MKRWQRGDGLAVSAIIVGSVAAWAATSAALHRVPSATAGPVAETAAPASHVAPAVETPAAVSAVQAREPEVVAVAAPAAHDGVAFRASSLGSLERIEGDFGGRLTWDGQGFRLAVPLAQIRVPVGGASGAVRVGGVRLSLVESGLDGLRVVRAGKLHGIRAALEPGEALWLENVVLELDGVPDMAPGYDRWLVIEYQIVTGESTASRVRQVFTHASADVLFALFGWEEFDGC